MSTRLLVTRGYGNGTFNGTIGDVVLRGYTSDQGITSTGSIVSGQSVLDGSGSKVVISTGSILASNSVLDGTGSRTVAVTGAIAATDSVLDGSSTVGSIVLATGALLAGQSTLAGSSARTIVGSGNIVIETIIAGSGSKTTLVTGDLVSNNSAMSGKGTTVVSVSGNIVADSSVLSNVEEEIDLPKIVLDPINGSYGSTEKINSNFELIETALNDQIMYRDNPCKDTTNMLTGMDMNLNRIYNLPDAVDAQDPATYGQLKSLLDTTGTVTVATESQLGSQIFNGVTTLLLVLYEVGTESLSVYVEGRKMALGRDYTEISPIKIGWINEPLATDNIDIYNRNLGV